jgi:hypothetical protein
MNKIIKHINKLPKTKILNLRPPAVQKKFEWYYNALFIMFLLFGINVFMNQKVFRIGLMIKIIWIMVILNLTHLYGGTNFSELFIVYGFLFCYIFHFIDIFMIFFFAIFVPNGNRLLEE